MLSAPRGGVFPVEVFAKGGDGAIDLAQKVVKACAQPSAFRLLYDEKAPIKEKIKTIVTEIYGGEDVAYAPKAEKSHPRH